MFSRVISGTVQGIDAVMIQVEADMSDGLPAFVMVGYLSSCVREAAERVRTALRNSGVSVPPRRITVNLSRLISERMVQPSIFPLQYVY